MKQKQKTFDYFAYIDSIMEGLDLPKDISTTRREYLQELIEDIVDDRIMQVVLSEFGDAEFQVMNDMLEKNKEMDEIDAVMAIADTLPELPKKLQKQLISLHDELTSYPAMLEEARGDSKPNNPA